MAFEFCQDCGHVAPAGTACTHCASTGAPFRRTMLLLGLTVVAGCKPHVNAKYGAEPEDVGMKAQAEAVADTADTGGEAP